MKKIKDIKLLIIGCGSIGKRHTRNAISIGVNPKNIISVDNRQDRLNEVKKMGIKNTFNNLNPALKKNFDVAIVCSPTSMHIQQSIKIAKLKKHILIEKPLDSKLIGSDKLNKITKKNNVTCMIAYIFRFHPGIKLIKNILSKKIIGKVLYFRGEFSEYLPDWHPYEDYRKFYMAKKTQGGGSILDQCHIMDLSHYLLGEFSSVQAANFKISKLEIKADDISEMIVKHKNGAISSIHTDIFGRSHKKYLEIKGEMGNIYWNFYKNEVHLYESKKKKTKIYKKFEKDFNKSYKEELKHFLTSSLKKNKSAIPLKEGISTMKLILAAMKSSKLGKKIKV